MRSPSLLSKAGVSHAMRSPSLLSKAGVSHRGREGGARRRHRRLHLAPRPPRSVCRPKTPPPGVHPAPRRRLPHRDIAAAAAAASFSPRACIRHGICSTDCMRVSSDGRALPARHVLPPGPGCSREAVCLDRGHTLDSVSCLNTHSCVSTDSCASGVDRLACAASPPTSQRRRPPSMCVACILRRTSGSRLTLGAPPLPLQNAAPAEGRSNRPRGGVAGWAGQPGWGWARGHDRHGGKPAQGREPASATRGPSRVGSGGPRMLL